MPDEKRDPELEFLRACWDAPPPAPDLHTRVQSAYLRECAATPWPRWVAAFAVVAAAALVISIVPRRPPAHRFQPVAQPRFIVISQGGASVIRTLLLVLSLGLPAYAAEEMNYSFRLANGALVLYQTFSQVRLSNKEKAFGTASASGNIIRRAMMDDSHNPWIAFQLHIDRKPGPGPVRFLLSMEPLGGWGFFGGKPVAREIENGDRILLDVLEEPGTGRKIYDTFQVGIDIPMQIMPLPHDVPQVPAAGTRLRITNPRFMDGLRVATRCEGTVAGTRIALSVPDKGRFLFSSEPAPGFRMEAIADGERLMFVVGSELFDIFTADPIVAPGSWYLWVRRENPPQSPISEPTLYLAK